MSDSGKRPGIGLTRRLIAIAPDVGDADSSKRGNPDRKRGLLRELIPGRNSGEGLWFLRLCVVMSGFAPQFLLMAIRGNAVVPDIWMWSSCSVACRFANCHIVLARLYRLEQEGNGDVPYSRLRSRIGVLGSAERICLLPCSGVLPVFVGFLVRLDCVACSGRCHNFSVLVPSDLHYVNVLLALLDCRA